MQRILLALALALTVLLSGCTLGIEQTVELPTDAAGAPLPAAPTQAPGAAQPTDTPAASQPTQPAPPTSAPTQPTVAPPAGVPAELAFTEVSNLDRFSSYRLAHRWTWQWDKGDRGATEIRSEVVQNPSAQRVWVKGPNVAKGEAEYLRVGDVTYVQTNGQWTAMLIVSPDLLGQLGWGGGAETFLGASKGQYMGEETVNGQPTRRYHYGLEALNPAVTTGQAQEASADVWVSPEHNVYVRVLFRWKGIDEENGPGSFELETNLSDLNAPITITAPEGVARPEVPPDVPIVEGAQELNLVGETISFGTSKSREEVLAFYAAQLPAQGWQPGPASQPTMPQYTKDNRLLTIIAGANEIDPGANVTLIVQKQ